jgi:hypothetical protein
LIIINRLQQQPKSSLSVQTPDKSPLQSIYAPLPAPRQSIKLGYQNQQPDDAEIRFSFSSSAGFDHQHVKYTSLPPARAQIPQADINRSFEGLSFDNASKATAALVQTKCKRTSRTPTLPHKPQRTGYGFSYADSRFYSDVQHSPTPQPNSPAVGRMPGMASIPELTKPKKAGYGFSYSDDMFYDSEEYPDTECEWDAEPAPVKQPEHKQKRARVASSNKAPTVIRQDTSFADTVVVRDVGSFHVARPQKRLSCTTATREDTIRVKHAANLLLKYEESVEVCERLMARLERMVYAALKKPDRRGHNFAATATHCALKLRDFLVNNKQERMDTGELQHAVDHEIEWAKWLVEASCTGVMHLKVPGCNCRPDWEEESDDED